MSTKILALTDALGNLVMFVLLPDQRHDLMGVKELIAEVSFKALLADKVFDADWLIELLKDQGVPIVIPQKSKWRTPLTIDFGVYQLRYLIENFFCKLKEYNRVAMCSEKIDSSFTTAIYLVAVINSSYFLTYIRRIALKRLYCLLV